MARQKSIIDIQKQIDNIRNMGATENGGLTMRARRGVALGEQYQLNIANKLQENGFKVFDDNFNYRKPITQIKQPKAVYAKQASVAGSTH